MSLSPEQAIEITKMVFDFAKSAIDAGKDPVAETKKRLLPVAPLVEEADDDIADAMNRKFKK